MKRSPQKRRDFRSSSLGRLIGACFAFLLLPGQPAWSQSNSSTLQKSARERIVAESSAPASTSVATVRNASTQVYRLIVEVDGAIKGGTAFLVSGRRIIATNHHVVEKGSAFTLGFSDKDRHVHRVPLRLIAIYPQKDLALLEALDDLPGEALALLPNYPESATDVFAIGFPAAADPQGTMWWASGDDDTYFVPSVIKGYVSRVLPNRWFSSQVQHQTPIIPGYSGGPMVDRDGVVIGISTSVHKEANGISYAVLAADLAEFVNACALPLRGGAGAMASLPEHRASAMAMASSPDSGTLKTFAIQPRAVATNDNDRVMLERANRMLALGDVVAARLILDYLVAQKGLPAAINALAKSYDPAFLREHKVLGVAGDSTKAAALYREAADRGDSEAKSLLTSVNNNGSTCTSSLCRLVNTDRGPKVACERSRL